MIIENTVSIFVLREDGKCLAIARRDDPNNFGLVGGKVDKGELLSDAIIRETQEESGLIIREPHAVFTCMATSRRVPNKQYMTTTFIASTIEGTPKRQPNEPRLVWTWPIMTIFGSYGEYNEKVIKHLNVPLFYYQDKDSVISNMLEPAYTKNGMGPALFLNDIEDL